jgi:hypothetical protein
MPQGLGKFSNDDVRRVFSRAGSVDETQVTGALEELERQIAHWTSSSTGLRNAIEESAAAGERQLGAGLAAGIDGLIEDFQQSEMDENAARAKLERTSLADITNPELLKAANKALTSYLDLSRSVSQAYHDARWRLMEARARFMPSAPSGPVHGEITDLDALIKS